MSRSMEKSDTDRVADANDIIRKQLAEIRDYKNQIKDLQIEKDTADEVRQTYFNIAAYDPTPPTWISGKGGRLGSRVVVVIVPH